MYCQCDSLSSSTPDTGSLSLSPLLSCWPMTGRMLKPVGEWHPATAGGPHDDSIAETVQQCSLRRVVHMTVRAPPSARENASPCLFVPTDLTLRCSQMPCSQERRPPPRRTLPRPRFPLNTSDEMDWLTGMVSGASCGWRTCEWNMPYMK